MSSFVKYLFAFDMDGTLTINNSWLDIKKHYGIDRLTNHLENMWQRNEITYEEWVRIELNLFKKFKVHRATVTKILHDYKLTPGLKDFLKEFKNRGIFAIISGGFIERALIIKHRLKMNYAFANTFIYDKKGFVKDIYNLVTYTSKESILLRLIDKHQPEKIIVFGDSHFDKHMWKHADYKVSINNTIDNFDIDAIISDFREVIEDIKKL